MTSDEIDHDALVQAFAAIRMRDVHQRRADRLRSRCHAALEWQRKRSARMDMRRDLSFRRVIGPALASVWCLAYLAEIIRRAAEVYGF